MELDGCVWYACYVYDFVLNYVIFVYWVWYCFLWWVSFAFAFWVSLFDFELVVICRVVGADYDFLFACVLFTWTALLVFRFLLLVILFRLVWFSCFGLNDLLLVLYSVYLVWIVRLLPGKLHLITCLDEFALVDLLAVWYSSLCLMWLCTFVRFVFGYAWFGMLCFCVADLLFVCFSGVNCYACLFIILCFTCALFVELLGEFGFLVI